MSVHGETRSFPAPARNVRLYCSRRGWWRTDVVGKNVAAVVAGIDWAVGEATKGDDGPCIDGRCD